ncbi:hypothetical protein DYB37_012529 [Aphanomyces astaci]|uniref:Uncharacterized protein n=1 Tax=Aphanomyces astaci TaxID=112090 RepID=A0A3R7ATE3_APHAT|nr:hypothetical protein DYB35_012184 [Aphanomyces astaci]RHZ24647.1 hypothetical protein DYB37_012529 [Aphanomyces astaci]
MQLAQAQADSGHYNQGQVVLDVAMVRLKDACNHVAGENIVAQQALLHGLAECKVTMSGASANHIDEADASSQNNSAKRNMLKLALSSKRSYRAAPNANT